MAMFAFVSMIGGILGEQNLSSHNDIRCCYLLVILQCMLTSSCRAGMNLTNGFESSEVSHNVQDLVRLRRIIIVSPCVKAPFEM